MTIFLGKDEYVGILQILYSCNSQLCHFQSVLHLMMCRMSDKLSLRALTSSIAKQNNFQAMHQRIETQSGYTVRLIFHLGFELLLCQYSGSDCSVRKHRQVESQCQLSEMPGGFKMNFSKVIMITQSGDLTPAV